MKIFFIPAVLIMIMLVPITTQAADPITGKWKLLERGKDAQNNPCPFIPEEMEFFRDATVSMSNMQGMKMKYKTKITAKEARDIMTRFPFISDPKTILLMMPPHEQDWSNRSMAYKYSAGRKELILEIAGWTPSKFIRTK